MNSEDKKSKPILSHLVLTASCLVYLLVGPAGTSLAQWGPASVETAEVIQKTIQTGRSFVGTVEPVRESTVGSEAEGKVLAVEVDEGDRVQTGEVLARLDAESYAIQLDAAKAELDLREAELQELRNGSRPDEIREAEARLGASRADREYWQSQFERIKRLNEQKVSSLEAVQDAERSLERAEQEVRQAEAALALVREGPRQERIAQAAASVRKQEHEIRLLEDRIDKHTVRAPFDGYITVKMTELGQWLGMGDPLFDMVELDFVDIKAAVPEDDISGLEPGDEARVEISALPEHLFTGTIVSIVPQADPASRTFPVQVRVENPMEGDKALIKAGMFARVTLSVGEVREAVLVPKDALVLGGPSPAVYAVAPSDQNPESYVAQMVPVQLGASSGGYIEVTGPVEPGASVVVLGNERLFPGQGIIPLPQGSTGDAPAQAGASEPEASEDSAVARKPNGGSGT